MPQLSREQNLSLGHRTLYSVTPYSSPSDILRGKMWTSPWFGFCGIGSSPEYPLSSTKSIDQFPTLVSF